jgi:hypothetical protein
MSKQALQAGVSACTLSVFLAATTDGLKCVSRNQQQQQQQLEPQELQQQVLVAVAACIQAQADALEQLKPAAAALQQQDIAARCVSVCV